MQQIVTKKAVMMIEAKNTLVFEFEKEKTKEEIKKEFEKMFEVKIRNIKTLTRKNKKYAYIRLKKEFPAIDIATKLGVM